MTHTFSISNMNCGGCVGHIKEQLEVHSHVTQVEVSLAQGEVVIDMLQSIPLADLQRCLDHDTQYAGRYIISEV